MEQLVTKNTKALKVKGTNPRIRLGRLGDPLSEGENAEEAVNVDAEDGGLPEPVDPMMSQLEQLTNIMALLAEDKKKIPTLERALEQVSVGSTDGTSYGSGKKSAAGRRALRHTFSLNPKEIYQMIERLIMEDLSSSTSGPGMPAFTLLCPKAWVEFQSRIGNYKCFAHHWEL